MSCLLLRAFPRVVNGTFSKPQKHMHQSFEVSLTYHVILYRGKFHYIGPITGSVACFGFFLFCLPGLLLLCCPCDTCDAYKYNGLIYNAEGVVIGDDNNRTFVPTAPVVAEVYTATQETTA